MSSVFPISHVFYITTRRQEVTKYQERVWSDEVSLSPPREKDSTVRIRIFEVTRGFDFDDYR